jgi:4-alpha-glucanotransferase
MITDLFGRTERFNLPGVAGSENWTQRLHTTVAGLRDEPNVPAISAMLRECGRTGR